MRDFTVLLFISIINNLLMFFILDKFSDFYLKHKYNDVRHSKRLYYFMPLQFFLSITPLNSTLTLIVTFTFFLVYIITTYQLTFIKALKYTLKFFVVYLIITLLAFFAISYVTDNSPTSDALLYNNFLQNLKGILLNSVLYMFTCFLLSHKKLKKQGIYNPYKKYVYLVLGLIVLVLFAFIIYAYTLNSSKEALENIVMVIFVINIIIIVLILSIYEKIVDSLQEAALKQLQQQKYELAQSYYEELSEKSKQLVSLRHDFKNHLNIIAGRLEQKDYAEALSYLERITAVTKSAGDLIITNNATVSAILQSKKVECERKGIGFTYTAAFEKIYKLTDMDFTIILGNILDNAIEAQEEVRAGKYLNISITQADTYLVIQCENPYLASPMKKNGRLVTSKKDSEFHGVGLLNVSEVCERYSGDFYYTYDNSIFTVRIMLPNY